MARTRLIKPGTFKNEELAQCTPLTRLLFIGLWQQADREGRLEYRPLRLKAEIFPYEFEEAYLDADGNPCARRVNLEVMLSELAHAGLITLYKQGEEAKRWEFIQVNSFLKHQNPHRAEAESCLPPLNEAGMVTSNEVIIGNENSGLEESRVKGSTSPALTLNPSPLTLNPSIGHSEGTPPKKPRKRLTANRFDEFWAEYPNKTGKKDCVKKWRVRGLDEKADIIIRDVKTRKQKDRRWLDGFVPNPLTYINGDRWEDDIQCKSGGATAGGFGSKDYGQARGG